MATPRAVRAAMVFSVATTGGAIYYFISEGGDPGKFDKNLTDATTKLANTGAKIADTTSTRFADTGARLKETVTKWTATPQLPPQLSNSKADSTEGQTADAEEKQVSPSETARTTEKQSANHLRNVSGNSKCHTCSGPRIWFFAEKLRLKRRITPYPDPSHE